VMVIAVAMRMLMVITHVATRGIVRGIHNVGQSAAKNHRLRCVRCVRYASGCFRRWPSTVPACASDA
jgi:hypothetical protein